MTTAKGRQVIKQKIEAYLYTKPHQDLRDEMQAILAASGMPGFSYKGKFYGRRGNGQPVKPLDSPVLIERMNKVMEQDRELNAEKAYINSYLTGVLNASAYVGTYMSMLPTALHDILRLLDSSAQPVEVDAETKERILRFNAKGEQLLRERILKNTILA